MKKIAVILLTISNAYTQVEIPPEVLEKAVNEVVYKRDNESLLNRHSKKYEVIIGRGIDSRGSFSNATLGRYFNENLVGELSYSLYSPEDVYRYALAPIKESLYQLDLSVKKFVSNSFYLRSGLGYSSYKATGQSLSNHYYSANYSELLWDTQIGNQWQWRHFTLGTSWIGASVSLKPLGGGGGEGQAPSEIPANLNLSLLNIYLGISF